MNLVAKEKVKGSWWGSRKKFEIFRVLRRLELYPDALVTRLISEKVTFDHRRIWPEFLTMATSGQAWQMRPLSAMSQKLLRLVEGQGEPRTDQIHWSGKDGKIGDCVRELEKRLLIFTKEIHTERGTHAKVLQTWSKWSRQANY